MRRKISLYIAGMPVDLDDQSFILFNYTLEEMNNPTIVKNSFSKQIVLKGTAQNNRIFGHLYRLDRVTQYGGSRAGIDFDPSRKTPFTIYNEMNEVLESGYVKLNNVSRNGDSVEYNITLYGGLGSFFYGLMYKEDGQKVSLSDMSFLTIGGTRTTDFTMSPEAASVKEAWDYLSDHGSFDSSTASYDFWNIINFAPAYNGLPTDFDADKALYRVSNKYANLPSESIVDGVTYGQKSDASTIMMTFANPHTEWEIQDLRWYLQRPTISIKSFIEAVCYSANNGGYVVELDLTFFNADNPYYNDAWMSLPMIAKDDRNSSDSLNNILLSTKTPAEILISYAKVFGLVFVFDVGEKKITIMQRSSFYQSADIIDLSKRIHQDNIGINPLVADSLIYQFGDQTTGQFAADYAKEYNRGYGIQRVNTGFEFNPEPNVLTKDLVLQDQAEVLESNRMFAGLYWWPTTLAVERFLLPSYEEVNVQLWATVDSEEQSQDIIISSGMTTNTGVYYDNKSYHLMDWLPKIQSHEADGKEINGAYVLMFFAGKKDTPIHIAAKPIDTRKTYYLTDDHTDMTLLNGGVPCWNMTREGYALTSLPSFRRNLIADDGVTIEASWEWGEPLARAVPDIQGDVSIYKEWWQNYLTDLYDNDTRVITCKVDLKGFMVNQSLMRKIFFFEGAIWRLNKIINHSLTTWDDTECEFIKIQDINNYIGQ